MTLASHKLLRPRTPEWVEYLNQRMPGETAHVDDQFFHGPTHGGTEVTASGSVTWQTRYGVLSGNPTNQSANDMAAVVWPLTSAAAPMTIETRGMILAKADANPMLGLLFANGTSTGDSISAVSLYMSNNAAVTVLATFSGTYTTATVSNVISDMDAAAPLIPFYMRLVWTAANTWAWALSYDGLSWTDFNSSTFAVTLTPTHFGVWATSWAQPYPAPATFDYVRVYDADLSV